MMNTTPGSGGPTGPSRRTMLKAGTAVAGTALAGGYGLSAPARAAGATASAATGTAAKKARVGATVYPAVYKAGTTWDQAMAKFNADVGRDFEVAKRFFEGASTWPRKGNLGEQIQSLVDRKCRGLLCFKPALDGSDRGALHSSLQAIQNAFKNAGITGSKVTLYSEQGLGKSSLTAKQFKHVYDSYRDVVHDVFPGALFVDFAGSAPDTWKAYRPAGVDGIAVDFYARTWAHGGKIDTLAQWANEAGQELGIWEIGHGADPKVTATEVKAYFSYLTRLQSGRLHNGHLVGDMAWFNGSAGTLSGQKLSPLYKPERKLLDDFFDTFNGVA